jgi:hypothetical protein
MILIYDFSLLLLQPPSSLHAACFTLHQAPPLPPPRPAMTTMCPSAVCSSCANRGSRPCSGLQSPCRRIRTFPPPVPVYHRSKHNIRCQSMSPESVVARAHASPAPQARAALLRQNLRRRTCHWRRFPLQQVSFACRSAMKTKTLLCPAIVARASLRRARLSDDPSHSQAQRRTPCHHAGAQQSYQLRGCTRHTHAEVRASGVRQCARQSVFSQACSLAAYDSRQRPTGMALAGSPTRPRCGPPCTWRCHRRQK